MLSRALKPCPAINRSRCISNMLPWKRSNSAARAIADLANCQRHSILSDLMLTRDFVHGIKGPSAAMLPCLLVKGRSGCQSQEWPPRHCKCKDGSAAN